MTVAGHLVDARGIVLRALVAVLCATLSGLSRAEVAEPVGYRMDEYRATVPATLKGATVVDTETARRLQQQGDAILVDVLPASKKPEGLRDGDLWMPGARRNIPGSVWLAGVGYGVLSEDLESYFAGNLERRTGGARLICFGRFGLLD